MPNWQKYYAGEILDPYEEDEKERLAAIEEEKARLLEDKRLADIEEEKARLAKLKEAGDDGTIVMGPFLVPSTRLGGGDAGGGAGSGAGGGAGSGDGGSSGPNIFSPPNAVTIGDPKLIINVPNDPTVIGTPAYEARERAEYEAREKAAAEKEIADMVAKGKPPPITIGNPIDVIGSAATGIGQIVSDPITGARNVITNIGEGIFGTGNGNISITPLPVDPITGLIITGAVAANATAATRARDAAEAAKAAGASPEVQAQLDAEAAAAAAAAAAQTQTPSTVPLGILTGGAANSGSPKPGDMGPFDQRTPEQRAADAAAAAQTPNSGPLVISTETPNSGPPKPGDMGPFDTRTPEQIADDAAKAAATQTPTTPNVVVPTTPPTQTQTPPTTNVVTPVTFPASGGATTIPAIERPPPNVVTPVTFPASGGATTIPAIERPPPTTNVVVPVVPSTPTTPSGGGTTTVIPTTPATSTNPFTMPTITPGQRDLDIELGKTTAAFKARRDALKQVYGNALDDYTDADLDAFDKVSNRMRGTNAANTAAASAQTIASNRALREANLADVNQLGGEALLNRQTLNSQLYGNLGQFSKEASAGLGRDMDALRLAEAKQLSPEDVRNSQQAAREAWSARGLVNSRGAVGSEILNRDSLARQREAEARAKVQQSYGNLQQATAMEMANVFDPQAAILGGQYGMQTQNYGTNAALYGQAANQAGSTQDYVRKVFNPVGEYPNNIYDFNANAATAASISAANNAASVEAARQAGMYGLTAAAMQNAGAIWNGLRWVFGG